MSESSTVQTHQESGPRQQQHDVGGALFAAFRHSCLQDALVVLAYAPKQEGCKGICSWPWAHALHSAALEGLQVNVDAVYSSLSSQCICLHVLLRHLNTK